MADAPMGLATFAEAVGLPLSPHERQLLRQVERHGPGAAYRWGARAGKTGMAIAWLRAWGEARERWRESMVWTLEAWHHPAGRVPPPPVVFELGYVEGWPEPERAPLGAVTCTITAIDRDPGVQSYRYEPRRP